MQENLDKLENKFDEMIGEMDLKTLTPFRRFFVLLKYTPIIIFGLMFLLIGGTISAVFLTLIDLESLKFKPDNFETIPGIVTEVKDTNSSVNDRAVMEILYEFEKDGKKLTDNSFATFDIEVGENVNVEVLKENSSISRIKGGGGNVFPTWTLFVLIFPLIGLIALLAGAVNIVKGMINPDSVNIHMINPTSYTYLKKALNRHRTIQSQFPIIPKTEIGFNSMDKGRLSAIVFIIIVIGIAYLIWIATK